MKRIDPGQLEKPHLEFGVLQIWVLGREFEDSQDYWDGNWLRVLIHCSSEASDVWRKARFCICQS